MDFFNEFNNLQKEIFKNIFSNSLKRPEQKGELKNTKPPKVQKLNLFETQNVKQNSRNEQGHQQQNNIQPKKFELKKIQPQNVIHQNSEPKILKKIIPVSQNFQIQNLIVQNQFLYPEIPKKSTENQKLDQNFPQVSCDKNNKIQSEPKKQKEIQKSAKQHKVKLPVKKNKRPCPKADENSNYKKNSRKSHDLEQNCDINIYETPRKSFLVPQAQTDSGKGLRRGRSKYRNSISNLSIEVPEKPFDEMNQEEFLVCFGLKRAI